MAEAPGAQRRERIRAIRQAPLIVKRRHQTLGQANLPGFTPRRDNGPKASRDSAAFEIALHRQPLNGEENGALFE